MRPASSGPPAAILHAATPNRRSRSIARQAMVHSEGAADRKQPLGDFMGWTTVDSLARPSTQRARTFRSRDLPSFGPAHHLLVVHLPKLMTCGLAAPALVSHARQKSMKDKKRCVLRAYAFGRTPNKGRRHTNRNLFLIGNRVLEHLAASEIVYNNWRHLRPSDEPPAKATESVLQRHG